MGEVRSVVCQISCPVPSCFICIYFSYLIIHALLNLSVVPRSSMPTASKSMANASGCLAVDAPDKGPPCYDAPTRPYRCGVISASEWFISTIWSRRERNQSPAQLSFRSFGRIADIRSFPSGQVNHAQRRKSICKKFAPKNEFLAK